ncbi:MAG TPA: UDP-N-acetylmuramoyl-L-alanyl-D-glutamate--2,6-diaminopimelate ligase [Patescibacteria group bacterium]|nr:UDP-N-acetylmuramoyl-L-alanyl-D-glutamate--2,6-diaminopimelate ligase [Patescibacteria group bacterium]
MLRKIKNFAHAIEAETASLIYAKGRRKIATIGVTGTDGKTTTSSLIFHILRTAGYNPAMVTTVAAQIGDKTYDTGLHTTTPSPFALQKYIAKARNANADYLVLEVTSHALDQNRTQGIEFKIGVLTNITHEHLDYHGTYENYVKVKSKLFRRADVSILNLDDDSYKLITKNIGSKKILTYSIKNKRADFNPKSVGVDFPDEFNFNYENFMAAISVAEVLGINREKVKEALATFKFPKGRQEIIYDKEFRAIVDFAHTPNSFARVLPVLKKSTKKRLIHIFGSAGQRDMSKRPLMGTKSSESADIIVLTAEDPRNEKIEDINAQIKLGIADFKNADFNGVDKVLDKKVLFEIPDRQKAIDFAIKIAEPGDTVVVTGKGHEQSMNLGHGETPWSDHLAIQKAIESQQKS